MTPPEATKTCMKCGRMLPLNQFRTRLDARCRRPVVLGDCRDCHLAYKQEQRRRKASRKGKAYRTKGDIVRDLAARKDALAAKRAARKARPRPTRSEVIARKVKRQRERYATDPTYQAQIKAKKIRRKRAILGALVEAVDREAVAERDQWRCGICGKKVSRRTWSLDHIVPLSKGGEHSYRNVTLAHRKCNSARGVGRLSVQAPLLTQACLGAG